jgi:hypothetical protein
MASIPSRVSERISNGLKKYSKVLAAARDRDVNESDTVVIVTDFLADVLGFEKYSEITTEFCVGGAYCDLAVKVNGKVWYLIEAKAAGVTLKDGHLRQAVNYAATHGVEWVALTNGVIWRVYRMRFEQPVKYDLVFELDAVSASPRDKEAIEKLFLLTKEGMAKAAIAQFHEEKEACNPFLLGAVLLSEPVVEVIRRELRRISPGARVEDEEVRTVLVGDVIKREVVEGEQARLAGTQVKKAATRALRRSARVEKEEAEALKSTPPQEQPLPAAASA